MISKLFSANPARIGRFDGPPMYDAVPASLVEGTPREDRGIAAHRPAPGGHGIARIEYELIRGLRLRQVLGQLAVTVETIGGFLRHDIAVHDRRRQFRGAGNASLRGRRAALAQRPTVQRGTSTLHMHF